MCCVPPFPFFPTLLLLPSLVHHRGTAILPYTHSHIELDCIRLVVGPVLIWQMLQGCLRHPPSPYPQDNNNSNNKQTERLAGTTHSAVRPMGLS